ncbi:hypothetical protein TWF281_008978 [Arthrobotrys megalospora]
MPRCFKAPALEIYRNLNDRRVVVRRALAGLANTSGQWQPNNYMAMDELSKRSRTLDLSLWRFVEVGKKGVYIGSEIVRYAEANRGANSDHVPIPPEYLDEVLDITGFKF